MKSARTLWALAIYSLLLATELSWSRGLTSSVARRFLLDVGESELSSDLWIPTKICQIIARRHAYVNFIYGTASIGGRIGDNATYRLEANLFQCMASLPYYTYATDRLAVELVREYESYNVFIIPEATEEQVARERVHAVGALLNAQQRNKHYHKYVFVWRGASPARLMQFFRLVWSRRILNAIVMTDTRSVYTYEPFSASGFRLRRLGSADEPNFFYDKLQDLYGYQLRISMFTDLIRAVPEPNSEYAGYTSLDGLVASTIVERLNATARYISPADKQNYGSCRGPGRFTGAIHDIATGNTHVGFNERFLLNCMLPYAEQLYPYHRRTLYLVVPSAKMLPEYLIFVNAFTDSLWRLLLLNFLLVMAIFSAMQRCLHYIPRYRDLRNFNVFEIFLRSQLGEPVERFAVISSLRQFLIGWILFSYVLTSIYFAKLESSFVHVSYEPEMDLLDELDQLKVPIYGIDQLFKSIEVTLEPKHWQQIRNRSVWLPLNVSSQWYTRPIVKKSKNVAFVLRDEMAKELLITTYDTEENRPTFHIVKEYLRVMPMSHVVTLGSPFLYKLQRIETLLFESGLHSYWFEKTLTSRKRKSYKVDEFIEELLDEEFLDSITGDHTDGGAVITRRRKKVVLDLDILQGAFYLWLIGIGISCVRFALEYGRWVWQQRRLVTTHGPL